MSELILKLAGDATIRGTTTRDGQKFFSVYDFINLVCEKSGTYAHCTWARLISEDSNFKDEIEFKMESLKYHGEVVSFTRKTRSRQTPVMTLRALQRLLLILNNKVASDFRRIVEATFTRFMSGDVSMIEEINSNAASVAPVHQAYRQALAQEPVTDVIGTKRQLGREEALFNLELHERHTTLNERQMTLHERGLALYEKSLALQKST